MTYYFLAAVAAAAIELTAEDFEAFGDLPPVPVPLAAANPFATALDALGDLPVAEAAPGTVAVAPPAPDLSQYVC